MVNGLAVDHFYIKRDCHKPYVTELVVGSCVVSRCDSVSMQHACCGRGFLREAEEVWSVGCTGHAVDGCSCRMLRDCVLGC